MRIPCRVTLAVVTLATLAVPAVGQRYPRVISRDRDSLTLDLPTSQTVLVLGVSLYGDVMLLHPNSRSGAAVPAGRQTLFLDQAGPWIAGGRPTVIQTGSGPQTHCFPDETQSLITQRQRETSTSEIIHYCTWMPNTQAARYEAPKILHLVILGTDSLGERFDLDAALSGFKPDGKSAQIASALAAHFTELNPTRPWWGQGMSRYARKP